MIRSFSEKLQTHMGDSFTEDEKGKRYFHFITDGASRAQAIITDILAYSRIDCDMKALESVDCNQLIEVVKKDIQTHVDEKNVVINYHNLPELHGNKTQLFQLFQNLINNARKYSSDKYKC